jgi:hypothetical protein
MTTARTGALGVATTTGDLYVVDAAGELERFPVGTPGQIIVADPAAVGPSGSVIGVKWAAASFAAKASFQCDAVDAVFKKIDLGGGPIDNPAAKTRGTHALLEYSAGVLRGIPWQRYMPSDYSGGDVTVTISWVSDGTDTGDVFWSGAFERENSGFDIDVDDFAAAVAFPVSPGPGVAGQIVEVTQTFNNADMDAIVAGEPLRLFVQRLATAGLTDKALLVDVVVEEV